MSRKARALSLQNRERQGRGSPLFLIHKVRVGQPPASSVTSVLPMPLDLLLVEHFYGEGNRNHAGNTRIVESRALFNCCFFEIYTHTYDTASCRGVNRSATVAMIYVHVR